MKNLVYILLGFLVLTTDLLYSQELDWVKGTLSGNIGANAVKYSPTGHYYVRGTFKGAVDLDPGPGVDMHYNTSTYGKSFIYVAKFDTSGNYIWGRSIGADSSDLSIPKMETDDAGNVFLSFQIDDSVDVDPGPGFVWVTPTLPFPSAVTNGAVTIKWNSSGAFEWEHTLKSASPALVQIFGICIENGTDIVIYGNTNSATVDMDPGPAVLYMSLPPMGRTGFIYRLDNSGNYVNSVMTGEVNVWKLNYTSAHDFVYSGFFVVDSVDADLGPGVKWIYRDSLGVEQWFMEKTDSLFQLNWAKETDFGYGFFSVDSAGKIVIAGTFSTPQIDLDLDAGTFLKTCAGGPDIFLAKYSPSGVLLWGDSYGSTGYETGEQVKTDNMGNIYMLFQSSGASFDMDHGSGTDMTIGARGIAKFNHAGDLRWMVQAKGVNTSDLLLNPSYSAIYDVGGFSNVPIPADFDPGPGVMTFSGGPYGAFLRKLDLTGCINFDVSIISVQNAGCTYTGEAFAAHAGGTPPVSYVWNTVPPTYYQGMYTYERGIYTVTATDATGCSEEVSVFMNIADSTSDIRVLAAGGHCRPGFTGILHPVAFNLSCDTVYSKMRVILDPKVVYNYAVPPPASVSASGDTLVWNTTGMNFFYTPFAPLIYYTTPASVPLGAPMVFKGGVKPIASETITTNNYFTIHTVTIGSHDPNDKQVSPQGSCSQHYIAEGDALTYTIRFQNTGSYEAWDVNILDTLDSDLDLSTFRVLANSHPMIPEIHEDSVLRFRFDNIALPDSGTDEPGSHGYVIFEIAQKPGLASGTEIHNRASIYFDYNDPVLTPPVFNTVISTVPGYLDSADAYVCPGGAFTFPNGMFLDSVVIPVTVPHHYLAVGGCDSIIMHTVHPALSEYLISVSDTLCAGSSYTFPDGFTLSGIISPVTHTSSLLTSAGCDSTIITALALHPVYAVSASDTICSGGSYTFPDGVTLTGITSPLAHTSTLVSASGCDSTIITTLVVNSTPLIYTSGNVCFGDSYTFPDGFTMPSVTVSTFHISHFMSLSGCDSSVFTNVFVRSDYLLSGIDSICAGDAYTFPDGVVITGISSPVTHTSSLLSSFGCDSTIITTVIPHLPDTTVAFAGGTLTAIGTATSYQWLDCDSGMIAIPGATAASYTPASSGHYAVQVTSASCSDTSACHEVLITAIAAAPEGETFSLVPNPARDWIQVNSTEGLREVQVTDLPGRSLLHIKASGQPGLRIELSGLSAGTYLVTAKGMHSSHVWKLIVY